jgi:hypothetical protein
VFKNVSKTAAPVFRLLSHLLGVKRQKSLRATIFWLRGLESYGGKSFVEPASQQLIPFVRENQGCQIKWFLIQFDF